MGNKDLEAGTNGEPQASYEIVAFAGKAIPENFKGHVFSRWLKSLRYGNDFFRLINSDDYFKAYQKYIHDLLNRPGSVLRIALLPDRDTILGWSLIEGRALHYVWVDKDQRNKGIGSNLVPVKIEVISHLTKAGMKIWNAKLPEAVFNPFY